MNLQEIGLSELQRKFNINGFKALELQAFLKEKIIEAMNSILVDMQESPAKEYHKQRIAELERERNGK